MHFANAVRDARIKQDALCRSRLSGVNVRHDSDVPATIQSYCASHGNIFLAGASGPRLSNPSTYNFKAPQVSVSKARKTTIP
jgi:hypothetical protein